MKRLFKFVLLTIVSVAVGMTHAASQDVQWSYRVNDLGDNTYEIVFDATIEDGWHMYDLGPYDDMGPNPTMITFEEMTGASVVGDAYEVTSPIAVYDDIFEMDIEYYEHSASFAQKVKVESSDAHLKGYLEWMVCNEVSCTPLEYWDFEIDLNADAANAAATVSATNDNGPSLWGLVLTAIMWGFAALLTPCVFPMIPMTVSFFLKGSDNKAKGRFRAFMYGLFIIMLYTLPIVALILITRVIGGDAVTADIFNWLATHWIPNLLFFIIFMIFAASFFGAFDITMPSKLVNKTDSKSDKGGLGGIFFMALTLVLVSFSCTGPIVGSVLIDSISGNNVMRPIITMLAFSVAFAIPFTILALFPSLLNKLPKSGGWLNSVKVVLGFIELALGLKFLSVADQTYHWGILDREIYLALWLAIFTLLGFYLLGKLKFKHDSDVKYISVGRLVLAIIVFAFVAYMLPGMWGAPLRGLSGYLPPIQSQDFVLDTSMPTTSQVYISGEIATASAPKVTAGKKYADFLKPLPYGIDGYYHYGQAMDAAKEQGKPLFIDFTGHGCVNCREMEQRVWADPEVQALLREEFVVVSLYGDDKKNVDEQDWITLPNGKVLKGLGRINSYFMANEFGANGQPTYIIVDHNGQPLVPSRGYDLSIPDYVAFLRQGLNEFEKTK